MKKHLVIPDPQVKPGVCINHLNALGHYILDIKPAVIVCLGDFAEMHSLSSYDVGTKAGEGARYEHDITAARRAMEVLVNPLRSYNKSRSRNKKSQYKPRMVMLLGNHENRINRHVNAYPILDGRLSTGDLCYSEYGWEVHRFLEVVEIDGILYSHYFPRNASGNIVQTYRGAPNARVQVQREGRSCTAGHLQGLDFHIQQRATRRDYGIVAGSFYLHDYEYLCPQGTAYWRGVIVKHEVKDGMYDPMFVSIDYLLRKWWDGNDYYV